MVCRILDVDHCVARLMEWSRFDHDIISAAVTQLCEGLWTDISNTFIIIDE